MRMEKKKTGGSAAPPPDSKGKGHTDLPNGRRGKLWTRDFSLITVGTIISAIASQTINLPLSLMVFDETKSTLLSAVLFISGMLPSFVLPIFIAPLIDRSRKKTNIVAMDYLMGILLLLMAYVVSLTGFRYELFIVFSFISGCIGAVYQLTYSAWYPDLITPGFEQKGYAVSTAIYPTVMMVMSPIAAWLYKILSIERLLLIIAVLTIIAATFELLIKNQGKITTENKWSWQLYKTDLTAGLKYLKEEPGLRNIYSYMALTNGTTTGNSLMTQAYFQSVGFLTVAMFAFLRSAETLGRIIGGFFQYSVEVKASRRFGITKFVYFTYELLDMLLLFLPYPLMLINRFICGALGNVSATLREASVQSYLPPALRAKINAIFSVAYSLAIICFQLAAGLVGDLIGFRPTMLLFSFLTLLAAFFLIALPSQINRKVYEATRVETETAAAESLT